MLFPTVFGHLRLMLYGALSWNQHAHLLLEVNLDRERQIISNDEAIKGYIVYTTWSSSDALAKRSSGDVS